MALRGQVRGDAEAARPQKCWRGEHRGGEQIWRYERV
jgi:hypothetical protein